MSAEALSTAAPDGWGARLRLGYAHAAGRTTLVHRTHSGPLAVQKAFYPEGPAVCHTLVLHPPGGMVAADRLEIDVSLNAGSHALVTMPGASKWYRSTGAVSSQRIDADVGPQAALEWLPPEAIVYNGARARLSTRIRIAAGGSYVGWEISCLGRTAAGETFDRGSIHQTTDVTVNGKLVWSERFGLIGGSRLLASAAGLGGAPVSAVMLAAGNSVPAELLAQCRAVRPDGTARTGVTAMPQVLAARYVGHSAEQAKQYLVALWRVLRPFFSGRAAVAPRIWNT